MDFRLALIIATKDRPKEIRKLLLSITQQSDPPAQILIIDAGTPQVEGLESEFPSLPISYYPYQPPSLTRQRNFGLSKLDKNISFIGFVDDDIIFYPDTVKNMHTFWDSSSIEVGGASFNITNYTQTKFPIFKSLFLLEAKRKGIILRSGVGTVAFPATANVSTEWLCGGATVWRRAVLDEFQFDEWFYELGWNEDLEFSLRAGRKYKMAIVATAPVLHAESPAGRIDNMRFGQIQVIHRMYVVKKYKHLSDLACLWASLGQTLVNFLSGIISRDRGRLIRSFGNCVGLVKVLCGQLWVHPSQRINRTLLRKKPASFLPSA